MKGGVCHGKRIAVQATAAGRKHGRTSHGKYKILSGRLCSSYSFHSSYIHLMYMIGQEEKKQRENVHIHYKEIFQRDNRMPENGDNIRVL